MSIIVDIEQAYFELNNLSEIKKLLTNNTLACVVKINNLTFGTSLNSNMIPIVDYEIEQIEKYLKGEENSYE